MPSYASGRVTRTRRLSANTNETTVHDIPPDVLALVLRRGLDSEHPGSLLCSSYIRSASWGRRDEELVWNDAQWPALLRQHFSERSLCSKRRLLSSRPPRGPGASDSKLGFPSILVCRQWHDVVRHHNVVVAIAAAAPSADTLPPSVRTLFVRLDVLDEAAFSRFVQALRVADLPDLEALVCFTALRFDDVRFRATLPCITDPALALAPLLASWRPSLRVLHFGGSAAAHDLEDSVRVRGPGARALAAQLPSLSALSVLTLRLDDPDGESMAVLAANLAQMDNLHTLDLSGSVTNLAGVQALAAQLGSMTGLHALNLSWMGIRRQDLLALPPHLESMAGLRVLNLNGNELGAAGLAVLSPCIAALTDLHELHLQATGVSREGMRRLAMALPKLKRLRGLHLRSNHFGLEGSRVFATVLPLLLSLELLDLSDCQIGVHGVRAILPKLQGMTHLRVLHLSYNVEKVPVRQQLKAEILDKSCVKSCFMC